MILNKSLKRKTPPFLKRRVPPVKKAAPPKNPRTKRVKYQPLSIPEGRILTAEGWNRRI